MKTIKLSIADVNALLVLLHATGDTALYSRFVAAVSKR
jgi:hypothetical protein